MSDFEPQPKAGANPADDPMSEAARHSTTGGPRDVAQRIEEIPPPDGAAVLGNLPSPQAADVAEYLDPQTAGDILAEMEPIAAASVIEGMRPPEASMVLSAMDPDDRVDVLEHVSGPIHARLLGQMNAADVLEVRRLQQYPSDTAGGIMTTQVTALHQHLTVENAISELRRLNEELEQIFYVYVVDGRRHLAGVLSMRDLILAKPQTPLSRIMIPAVKSVPATMDQEEVARLMHRYNYLAMPVVDEDNRLLGLITVDDVVDVITEEATEDVQRMFGAGPEERLTSSWQYSFRKRIGWLEVNLATAFMAAAVVGIFRQTIAALPILAAYQTIVSGMGGNAGAQAMAVAIRGLAVGEVDRRQLRRILYRQAMVGLLTGVVIGVTTGVVAGFFNFSHHGVLLGVIVAAALLINLIVACISGVTIPFLMKSLGFDPAQSATIFATTVTDCCGFFATLGLAWLCMGWLTA